MTCGSGRRRTRRRSTWTDDIEKTPARTDFRAEAAFHWLDRVKRHMHGLTMTGNLALQSLTSVLSDVALARIDQTCSQIEM